MAVGWSRAQETLPVWEADRWHFSDVQSAAAPPPPIRLDLKQLIRADDLDEQGKPILAANPERPYADTHRSPVYRAWKEFFERATVPVKDIQDEWKMVAHVGFGHRCVSKGRIFKRCHPQRISWTETEPEGSSTTLKFAAGKVTIGDIVFRDGESVAPYWFDKDALRFAEPRQGLYWSCRKIAADDTKLMCEAHSAPGDSYERHTFFTVYKRADTMDSLEPLGSLAPFLPKDPAPVRMIQTRPKD